MTLGVSEAQSPEGGLPADHLAETAEAKQIEGRSLGQIALARLKKDKIAIISAVLIVLIVAVAVLAPLIVKLNGFPPDQFNKVDSNGNPLLNTRDGGIPIGGLWGSGMSTEHWMGIEPQSGRDVFSRLVYGTRVSLLVALGGTIIAIVIGTVVGMVSGYFRGWVDRIFSIVTDSLLALPALLLALILVYRLDDLRNRYSWLGWANRVWSVWFRQRSASLAGTPASSICCTRRSLSPLACCSDNRSRFTPCRSASRTAC